ncbi:MAG: hypothetical protein ABFE08_00075 [Armatimonadia bacterium]
MRNRTLTVLIVGALLLTLCQMAMAKVYLFDLGTDKSAVQNGFAQITPQTLYPANPAGFAADTKLQARDQAYTQYEESSRGKVPPPMWTTPLTQDGFIGAEPAEFVAKVEPGTYHVWVLCGTSTVQRSQVFDFEIKSPSASRAVQFENGHQFRDIYLDADAANGEVRLQFTPRSLFAIAAIGLWQDADGSKVQQEIIAPQKQLREFLPIEEQKKWTLDQRPDATPWPAISETDTKRGYLVHTRHWAEVVYPDTVPIPQEINPGLRAFATPGEFEPLNFIVWPLRAFKGAIVRVSDLKTANGVIPAKQIEIRRVRYMYAKPNYSLLHQYRVVPDVLMPYDPNEPLPEKQNARYWLTVRIPETAKPGMYRGTITFTPAGSTPQDIPVLLRVLPIKLQEDPSKLYGIYYRDPLDDWSRAKDDVSKEFYLRKSETEMQDLIAHGTRNVVTSLGTSPEKPGEPGVFAFNFDLMQTKIDRWRKYNCKFPLVVGISAGAVYKKYTGDDLGSHIGNVKLPPPEYAEELSRMVKAIETERVKRGWPDFLYYPIDEPSSKPDAVAFMVETLKGVRNGGGRTYVTADPTNEGFAPMKPYVDVWCTQPFLPWRDELLADKKAHPGVDYWCYPNHVSGENDHTPVNGARMTYGFGFWRSGFTALIPWIYRADVGDPWNYLSGSMSDFMNRTEDNGRPIPVAIWEAYREGYDDYRYIYTLERKIADAKARGGKWARGAADAEKQLKWIWDQIRVQPKYKYDNLWEPREIDVYRWLVAEQILKLQALGVK